MRKVGLTLLIVITIVLAACAPAVAPTSPPEVEEPAPAETEQPAPAETEPPAPVETEPPAAEEEPALLRVGRGGSPDTLNPGTAVLSEAYTIFELVYDSMYDLQ